MASSTAQVKSFFPLLVLIILLGPSSSSFSVKECEGIKDCDTTVEYTSFAYYSSYSVYYSYLCFNPGSHSRPKVLGDSVQVRNFKPRSSWVGAYLLDMHGVALTPLFIPHRNLSCTEYVLSQVADGRLSMEMKHYLANKVDYRFDFNQGGWIEYSKRYGCAKESLQVNNTRIIDTDYENYVIIMSCAEVAKGVGHHKVGYLLLVPSNSEVSEELWAKLQEIFFALDDYSADVFTLPDRSTLFSDRESLCSDNKVLGNKNVLCPKPMIARMLENQYEVVKELSKKQKEMIKAQKAQGKNKDKVRTNVATAYDKKEKYQVHDVHVAEISCLCTMFVAVAMALYWTHFAF